MSNKTDLEAALGANARYGLGFISDQQLFETVQEMVWRMRSVVSPKRFMRGCDPVKMLATSRYYGLTPAQLVEFETARLADKATKNLVGYLHQNMFHNPEAGWCVADNGRGLGYDLVNLDKHIYVEIKTGSRHNRNELQAIFHRMKRTIDGDPEAVCMLAEVLTRKHGERPFNLHRDVAKPQLAGMPDNIAYRILHSPDLLDDGNIDVDEILTPDIEQYLSARGGDNFDLQELYDNNVAFRTLIERDEADEETDYNEGWVPGDLADYLAHHREALGGFGPEATEALPEELRYLYPKTRRISIDRLYEIVYGDAGYFQRLIEALPRVFADVLNGHAGKVREEVTDFFALQGLHLEQCTVEDFYDTLCHYTFEG